MPAWANMDQLLGYRLVVGIGWAALKKVKAQGMPCVSLRLWLLIAC